MASTSVGRLDADPRADLTALQAPRAVRKAFQRAMEDIVLSSLERIERTSVAGLGKPSP